MPKQAPAYFTEQSLINQGYPLVAGLDEVGRGCWAGPVVAAVVIISPELLEEQLRINDSKQLTAQQRLVLSRQIRHLATAYGVGQCSAQEIDQMGIQLATILAMKRAYWQLSERPDWCLIDGRPFKNFPNQSSFVIDGDARCLSIAAASIVAKTFRDTLMSHHYHALFPNYGFANHKGYGTKEHQAALRKHGITAIHRRTYRPIERYT